jgi:hypothetical protein
MATETWAKLREAAEAVRTDRWWDRTMAGVVVVPTARAAAYITAANPAVILALLDERDALAERADNFHAGLTFARARIAALEAQLRLCDEENNAQHARIAELEATCRAEAQRTAIIARDADLFAARVVEQDAELARLRTLVPAACPTCEGRVRFDSSASVGCSTCAPFGGRGAVMTEKGGDRG